MLEYLKPGVYVEEVSYGARAIEGVSTSMSVFIDVFKDGPEQEATMVSSFNEFDDVFGGLYKHSEASYGIQQFFLIGGKRAQVVRVEERGRPGKAALLNGLK